ncbi:tripartite tricarboxylate transporter substrate binding protein [Brevibacillus marinus]|uniref:tripartite tricarboxylate transporter substrate binding protein n=1 Tax=Brevibacillus marinus TaxID=2496837 RepID=UPI000F821E6E|nr:tripartite tricarboxylate transporter substrate binding protein [Brevibacillus marinus]
MKKYVSLILTLCISLALAACGQSGSSGENTQTAGGGQAAPQQTAEENPNYPDKPVRIVAPTGAGGGWDTTARLTAKALGETGLVTVGLPVENIEGGSGKVFLESFMKNNVGDPYTIFVNSPPIIVNSLQGFKYSYKDVTPIAGLITEYAGFVVKADSPYQTLDDVIQALKKDPSSVKLAGGSAPGGMDHLSFMLTAKQAGIDITKINYVPFQGGGEALTALLGNNVDLVSTGLSEALGQMEAGKVRILATTGPNRLDGVLKDIPTVKELGYDATFEIWRGMFGAKDMPEYARKYWEDRFAKLVETPQWKEILEQQKWISAYRNSADFEAFLDEQTQIIGGLLKDLGIIQ